MFDLKERMETLAEYSDSLFEEGVSCRMNEASKGLDEDLETALHQSVDFDKALKHAGKAAEKSAAAGEQTVKYKGEVYKMAFDRRQGYWEVTQDGKSLVNITIKPIAKAKRFLKDWLDN